MTTNEPRFWAVILIGPPGAGKDTQAGLLSEELGLFEIKTSAIIDQNFKASPDDPIIKEQVERKQRGEMVEPQLVLSWVLSEIKNRAGLREGIVMSGSPRTMPEASAEMPVLKQLYGENLKIVYLSVNEEEAVKRNAGRRICQANRHPIPNFPEFQDLTACPKDGSPIIKRIDDAPETLHKRYQVYLKETTPVLDFLSKEGYNIIQINGEKTIEDVHRDILDHLW
ncbi:MAG TPA: nucleoside monophosphate kinase [Candidatus Paceibacterota bacterium]|nr:nucleoside monophosphate kinase [Candidatus Paceibacterota bacterium]